MIAGTARKDAPAVAASFDGLDGGQLAELQSAFEIFNDATATLERQYRSLQSHVRSLRDELARKNRALRESRERERSLEVQALRQSRLAAMGEMAATLAHEVRNPLGAMALFTKLLADDVGDRPSAANLVEQIDRGIADLNHLVENILDFTRLKEPRLARVALREVFQHVLALAAPALGAGVQVEIQGADAVSWSVDQGLLTQALLNLLRNAGEAMEQHGCLTLVVEREAGVLRIVVADSGPGVPAGSEEAIFAPFYSTKERGTGLGLAVSRAAVAAHGGTLSLRRSAEGARFVVALPEREDAAAVLMGAAASEISL